MKTYGIELAEGSDISNLTVDSGGTFPAAPSLGELFYVTGLGLHLFDGEKWVLDVLNDDKRLHAANNIVVQLDPGQGQFKTVKEAIDSITDATSSNRYVIQVQGGNYVEDNPVTMKRFVSVVGWNAVNTIITAKNPSKDLIVGVNDATLEHVALIGASGEGCAAIRFKDAAENDKTRSFIVNDVRFGNNHHNVYVSSSGSHTNLYLFNGQFGGSMPYNEGLRVESTNSGTARLLVRDSTTRGATAPLPVRFGYASGTGAELLVVASVFKTSISAPAGVGMHVRDGAVLRMVGCTLRGFQTGLWVENAGAAPTISIYNLGLESNVVDVSVEHPGTHGTFQGTAARSKVTSASNNISILYLDPEVPGTNIAGRLNVGPTPSLLTDVTDLIIETPSLGLISGGGVEPTGGFGLVARAGSGYLRKDGNVTRVSWPETTLTISPGAAPYIYVDKNGGLEQSPTLPDELNNIVLARAQAGASTITALGSMAVRTKSHGNAIEQYLRQAIGPVYVSGSIVTENATTPRAIDVSAGKAYYGTIMRWPSAKTAPQMLDLHRSNGQPNTTLMVTQVPNDTIDDGTNLVPMTAGYFTKHALYSASEGAFQSYFLAHGQAQYATLEEARSAPLPVPRIAPDAVPIIAGLIMQQGVNQIVEIQDLRPMIMRPAQGGTSASNDHSELSGLENDDHPQYMLANGGRAMVGNLSMNGMDIVGVNQINGLSIQSHGSRHAPQGQDPIPTAAAVDVSSATTNSAGVSNALSRADHTHRVTGFQPLSDELTAISALDGYGFAAHTHEGPVPEWGFRSLVGAEGQLVVTNGDGRSGNPTFGLSPTGTAGTFATVTTDAFGRVTAGSPTVNWTAVTGRPTTLAGYGVTDAQEKTTTLTALLNSLAGVTAGVVSITSAGAVVSRSLSAPAAGLTIANPTGVAGNPTFALANDLAAVEGLATLGITARTAADTWATRTITGTAPISVANGSGVAGDPVISLSSAGTPGTYRSVTTDQFGRVTAGTNPTTVAGYGITDAVANAGSVPRFSSGTLAARPAAGTLGAMYLGTDTRTWYRDSGAAWEVIIPAFTGDVVSPVGSPTITLSNVVTAGTYDTVTVDAKGRVVSGTYAGPASVGQIFTGTIPSQTGTSTIVLNSTSVPTTSQGTQLVSQTLTPKSTASKVIIEFAALVDSAFTGGVFVSVFRGSTFIGMAITATQAAAGSNLISIPTTFSLRVVDTPGVTTPLTYSIRLGGNTSGTWYLGRTESHSIGGINRSSWVITEYV